MHDTAIRFISHLRGTRSARTTKTYGAIAASFLAFVEDERGHCSPWRRDVESFLFRPCLRGSPRSAATHNQELAALRAFSRFARREGLWDHDPTEGVPFVREPRRNPTVLTAPELRRLFEAAAKEPEAFRRARNLAILAVLSQAGLRVHELVGLDVDQVDLPSRTLVNVAGKGGTVSDVPLNAEAAILLRAWLDERPARAAANKPALFVSSRGSRLSIRSVERLLERLRAPLGTKKKVTPHTLRHSAATIALVLGADLSTVGDLLRHADLNTTRQYLHLVDERTREAVRRLGTTVPASVLPQEILRLGQPAGPATASENQAHFPVDGQYAVDDAA